MDLTAADIAKRLGDRVDAICPMLLPGGKLHGKEWLCGDVSGGPGESLKVTMTGPYAGQWRDWSTNDHHGDILDLWRIARGLTPGEAVKQAKDYLGIVDPVKPQEKRSYNPAPKVRTEAPSPNGRAFSFLTETRKIKPEILDRLKIEIDSNRKAIVFPCYSPAGEIINRSYRTLGEKKKVWQDEGCAPSLFGWQAITEDVYRSKTILLCEGQIDAATWTQWGIPALSVPNGTGASWIEYEWDNISLFDTIYLAFDNDDAGRKITETAIARLGKHRCLIVGIPKKDANDCLLAGFSAEDARDWVASAKRPRIQKLVTTGEMEERLVAEIRKKPEPFTLPFMQGTWPHDGFWFRPGEITIWGGFSHAGKSTILNYTISQLIAERSKVFVGSFEMRVETQLRKLASVYMGSDLKENAVREFARNVGENLIFADVVGSMKRDELMEMVWFAFRRYGATHFIIDSLMRIQELEEDWPAQGEFCNRLQDFAKETQSHIHLVAHLGKPSTGSDRPSMYNIKGSSLLVNNADNVLLILRNPKKEKLRKAGQLTKEDEKTMHDSEVIVEKQRETGWTGLYRLRFDPYRYMYRSAD